MLNNYCTLVIRLEKKLPVTLTIDTDKKDGSRRRGSLDGSVFVSSFTGQLARLAGSLVRPLGLATKDVQASNRPVR